MRGVSLLVLALVMSACGSGGTYTQEELDARIEAAVADALEDQSGSSGSTEAPTTTASTTTTTTTRPPTTTTSLPILEADDFFAEIDVLKSSCFGSAGANVEFEVLWGWPGEAYGTLTYEIRGLDDGAVDIATTEIVGTEYYSQSHHVGIPTCDPESIIVVPTRFRPER